MNHSHLDNLAKGAGIGVAGRFLGRLFSVLAGIVSARLLGPYLFGLYSIGLVTFRLIELIIPLGFDTGVIKFGANTLSIKASNLKGLIINSLGYSLGVSILFGFLLFIFSPWISNNIFHATQLVNVFRFFSFLFPPAGMLAILAASSRLTYKLKYSILTQDLGQPLLGFILVFGLIFFGISLERVILAEIASYLFALIIIIYFTWRLFPFIFDRKVQTVLTYKNYFSFSFTAALTIFLSTLAFSVDRLFVGALLSPMDAGLYQTNIQISLAFPVVLSGMNRILLPIFSSQYKEKDIFALQGTFRVGTKWVVYISMPILLMIILNPVNLLTTLYGTAYASGWLALVILMIGQLINVSTGAVGPLLLIGGYQKFIFLLSGATLFLNVVLSIFFISSFGLVGAAVSNSLSIAFLYVTALVFVRIKMKIWPYDRRYYKGIIAILFSLVAALITKSVLNARYLIGLLVQLIVIFVVFLIVLCVEKFDEEDQVLINVFRERFGRVFVKIKDKDL